MKKFDIFCWVIVGLLLVFLWHSSSIEFFQDTSGIRGPPYTTSDAAKIVSVMPDAMKTSLKTSTGSDEPAQLIAPITDIMSDFHAVYARATAPMKSSDVDSFLQGKAIPAGLSSADMKTLLVAYFVTPTPGTANAPLTDAQVLANAQAAVQGAASSSNAAAYAAALAAVGQTGGYTSPYGPTDAPPPPPPSPSGPTGAAPPPPPPPSPSGRAPTGGFSSLGAPITSPTPFGMSSGGRTTNPYGMQVGGPMYGGLGSNANVATPSGNWASVGSNYPTMYGPSAKATSLPNSNSSGMTLTMPTACQVGADGNTMYMPGCRAPSDLGAFAPSPPTQKMDGDPLGFLPDYRAFMK